jgi:hypothetical protein
MSHQERRIASIAATAVARPAAEPTDAPCVMTRAVRTATKGRGDGRGESAHRKAAQPILKWRPN